MFNAIGQRSNKSKIKKFVRSKLAKYKKTKHKNDFIIRYNTHNNNIGNNEQPVDHRRLVFISLIGLYQSYQRCTPIQLYNALIIIPLKRKWIDKPFKYNSECKTSFISQLDPFQDTIESQEFIDLLKFKDSQGLVFWMLDEYENKNEKHKEIAPLWQCISIKLETLYDPITGKKYKPIQFDDHWWKKLKKTQLQLKFATADNVKSILYELWFLSMKYNEMQEIIYQSNPESLNPIISLNENTSDSCRTTVVQCTDTEILDLYEKQKTLDETSNENVNKSNWFILDHYDPYDIDNIHL